MAVDRFNRLTLIEVLPDRSREGYIMGRWLCDCGTIRELRNTRVKNGYTKSCGCLAVDRSKDANIRHGMRTSTEYQSWTAMKHRCHNPIAKDYPRYGAVGITVCDEWKTSFERFFAHIGPRPPGTSVDRIKANIGYQPGNVRWATPREQARNRRKFLIINTPEGRMPLVDYAMIMGITGDAARLRFNRGKLEGCSKCQ